MTLPEKSLSVKKIKKNPLVPKHLETSEVTHWYDSYVRGSNSKSVMKVSCLKWMRTNCRLMGEREAFWFSAQVTWSWWRCQSVDLTCGLQPWEGCLCHSRRNLFYKSMQWLVGVVRVVDEPGRAFCHFCSSNRTPSVCLWWVPSCTLVLTSF